MTKVHIRIRMVWVALVSGESGAVLGAVNISYLPLVPVEDAHCGAVRPGRKAQTHISEHMLYFYIVREQLSLRRG